MSNSPRIVTPAEYIVQNLAHVRAVTLETANGLVTVNQPRSAYYTTDGRMTVRGRVKGTTVAGSKGADSIRVYHY